MRFISTDVAEVVGDFVVGEVLSPPLVSGRIISISVVMVSLLVGEIALCEESVVSFITVISEFVLSAIINNQFRTITIHPRRYV